MKVLKYGHPYSRMTKEEQEKVSILKLAPERKHVKGVGMKNGKFYVIVENSTDDAYLSFVRAKHTSRLILTRIREFLSFTNP
jgi:hypothetical protein|tara:strand:- start:497 stop:742 length:246 start_codon:yes stop_codon:yes gene_type:complete